MARFAATMNAIEKGLENVQPSAGVKAIDEWIGQLGETDARGAKGLARDLERLKKELEKDEPKDDAVRKLLGKLGAATTKLAEEAEGQNAEKLRELGGKLSEAGTPHEGGEDDEDEDETEDAEAVGSARKR